MLGFYSTWAPAGRITKLGSILRFEFPTKEAEIQAHPSSKCEQRANHRRESGKQGTESLPLAGVAQLDHFGRQEDE